MAVSFGTGTPSEGPGGTDAGVSPDRRLTLDELEGATARGAFWTAVQNVTAIPIAFAANALVARMLGPGDYGRLAVISLSVSVAAVLTNGGTNDAVIQWGAAAHSGGRAAAVDRLLRRSLGYRLLVQVPLLTVVVLLVARDLPWQAQAMLAASVALLSALGSAALCVAVENLTARNARLSIATNVIVQASIVVGAWLSPTAVSVWAARTASGAIQQAATLVVLSPRRRRVILRPALPRDMPAGFWRYCAFTTATATLGMLVSSRIEVVALTAFADPGTVGVYAVAFGVAAQLRTPVDAFFAPFVPAMAGILEEHPALAARSLNQALRVNGLIAGVLLMLVPLAGVLVPLVYGTDYRNAARYVPLLAVAATGQALINPLLAAAQGRRQGKALLMTTVAALAVDIVVALATVPLWGVWGAVAATAGAQACEVVILVLLQRRAGLVTWTEIGRASMPYLSAAVLVVAGGSLGDRSAASVCSLLTISLLSQFFWCALIRHTSSRETLDAAHTYLTALPHPAQRAGHVLVKLLLIPSSQARLATRSDPR